MFMTGKKDINDEVGKEERAKQIMISTQNEWKKYSREDKHREKETARKKERKQYINT